MFVLCTEHSYLCFHNKVKRWQLEEGWNERFPVRASWKERWCGLSRRWKSAQAGAASIIQHSSPPVRLVHLTWCCLPCKWCGLPQASDAPTSLPAFSAQRGPLAGSAKGALAKAGPSPRCPCPREGRQCQGPETRSGPEGREQRAPLSPGRKRGGREHFLLCSWNRRRRHCIHSLGYQRPGGPKFSPVLGGPGGRGSLGPGGLRLPGQRGRLRRRGSRFPAGSARPGRPSSPRLPGSRGLVSPASFPGRGERRLFPGAERKHFPGASFLVWFLT